MCPSRYLPGQVSHTIRLTQFCVNATNFSSQSQNGLSQSLPFSFPKQETDLKGQSVALTSTLSNSETQGESTSVLEL